MRDSREIGRGLAGLLGLLAVVVGVPVGLFALGGGPGGVVPSGHGIVSGLRGPITDSAVLRAASLLCWLLWAMFVVAVVVELARQARALRGVRAPTTGRFGVPGLQGTARTLVLMAMLVLPPRGFSQGGLAAPVRDLPAATLAIVDRSSPPIAAADREPPDTEPVTVRYVVQRYDSPWRIAERHLGDGTRWREIRDAEGRPLASRRHPATASRTIYAGEVLLLPSDVRVSETPRWFSPAAAGRTADTEPEPRSARPPVARSASPSPVVLPTPTPPVVPPAAPVRRLPAFDPASRRSGADPPPLRPPPRDSNASTTTQWADRPPVIFTVRSDQHDGRPVSTTLIEAGLVSAGVIATIRILRRRQARHRPFGRRIRLPSGQLARTELALRFAEQPDRLVLVDKALRILAQDLSRAAVAPPTIAGVLVDSNEVEVLLTQPATPPAGWAVSAEGFRWRFEASSVVADDPTTSAPLPALVPLGKAAAGDADALINLEAAGMVGIAGDPIRAAGVVRAIATSLAMTPWANATNLILIGFGQELATIEHVRAGSSLDELVPELESIAAVMTGVLAEHHCTDPFAGRVQRMAGDGWAPTIVLCARPVDGNQLATLTKLCRPGCTVLSVVPIAEPPVPWVIDVDRDPMPVDPLRIAIEPTVLSNTDLEEIGELLALTQDEAGAATSDPPYDQVELTAEDAGPLAGEQLPRRSSPASALAPLLLPPVLVRVLGTVEIDAATEFRRAKSRELVVYLAMHPSGVGEAELDEALWPSDGGRIVRASTRDSTVSVARTAVGGPTRLLPAQGQGREKRYQLSADVSSDWAVFCSLHREARASGDAVLLDRALDLVRGRPFEGVASGRTYGWIHTEGHARHIEAEVADAADLLAGWLLEQAEPARARMAARRGLMADPLAERLWVRLMEAADALGESQEIERVMDEMDVVLELDGDFSGLHPHTLRAYERLSRRGRTSRG